MQQQQQAPRRRAAVQQQAFVQYAPPPAQPSRKARQRGGAPIVVYQAPPPQPRQPQYVTRVVQQPAPVYSQPARTVQHVVHMRPEPALVRMGVSHGGMGGAPAPVPAHLAARMQPAPQPQQRTVYVHHQQHPHAVMHHQQGNGSGYYFAEQAPVGIARGSGGRGGYKGGKPARMSAVPYY
jgi:hypothetical protein